jgi:nucleoside phosphorylase
VHYGNVGSGDRALRSICSRDALAQEHDLIAFDMEGKGFANASFAHDLGWLVIRGVSDYGDSRTDGTWRGYASLSAAAYARALIAECAPLA